MDSGSDGYETAGRAGVFRLKEAGRDMPVCTSVPSGLTPGNDFLLRLTESRAIFG